MNTIALRPHNFNYLQKTEVIVKSNYPKNGGNQRIITSKKRRHAIKLIDTNKPIDTIKLMHLDRTYRCAKYLPVFFLVVFLWFQLAGTLPDSTQRFFKQRMIKAQPGERPQTKENTHTWGATTKDLVMKNKNDYSAVAYQGSRRVNFMRYVHDVRRYVQWLAGRGIQWSVINVYDRRTREFVTRFYSGQEIISKPK